MLSARSVTAFAYAVLISSWFAVHDSASAAAPKWPDNAFAVQKHNFGTVAVAAKTEFRFPVFNPYNQPLHIQTVRRSCGCTTPIVETEYVQPGQTGSILARFNTDTFRGTKGADLTVVIDQPFYSEVRLRVDGYIRSDMVFHPGSIKFGSVNQGEAVRKSTRVMYAGRDDWEIADVRSNVPWLVPSRKLTSRGAGSCEYELTVAIREDAPTGVFQNEIVVITNDSKRPEVPLPVSGKVSSPLSIAPQAIALGSLKPGQEVRKTLVIKGDQPFTIKTITCAGWDVEFPEVPVAKTMHIVPTRFMPTDASGPQKVAVEITTAGEASVTAKAILTADVRKE
ncbi:DUF1573 domain-containing protein [Roseiconus nitratireducens]|uniref:DUF1573 domain-containing protein n=1 Tax=Roseiconus nitratireducens TaxID=2605748 RepID=A0A5M6D3W0_9BACT|nr:DUF1573 domain-containing protein [Roseiconus nitratireducens]KAA5539875.1 DUF1573 domain-containing protein [Roseiconus nitratireducens]